MAEYDLTAVTGEQHLTALVRGLAAFANAVRAAIETADSYGDKGTSDLFTAVSRDADKDLWFLEAHLQG